MPDIFFEDLQPGTVTEFGRGVVDRDEMVAFARLYDPQPFHLDEAAAEASSVGRLIASGWYSCAIQMRMLCREWLGRAASLGGPGVEELRWLRPVVAGDVLTIRQVILDTRVLRSRPDRGIVRFSLELLGADGEARMRLVHLALVGLRGSAGGYAAVPPEPSPEEPPPIFAPERPADAPRFFEDVEIGRGVDLGVHRFLADDVVGFARLYDPQDFHLDADAASRGPFGALAASGWHTAAAWMGLLAARLARIAAEPAGPPHIGVSPGFTDLRWMRPVLAGDAIRFTTEPVAKRLSASRPGWGITTSRNRGVNARGETVFEFTGSAFWQTRGAAGG